MSEFEAIVSERWVYPVKGMAGCEVPDDKPMYIDQFGVVGSRRWMVVDEHGKMVNSKRDGIPEMLYIQPRMTGRDTFTLDDDFEVSTTLDEDAVETEVYMDGMRGFVASPYHNSWLNSRLGYSGLRLIQFDPNSPRNIHPDKAWKGPAPRAFVDSVAIHMVNHITALDAAQRWGEEAADIRRYRPDIVFRAIPGIEFGWHQGQQLAVGAEVTLGRPRPLERCPLPTRHPTDRRAETAKQISVMFAKDFKMLTPQSDDLRSCFGIGLDVVQTGIIHSDSPMFIY